MIMKEMWQKESGSCDSPSLRIEADSIFAK